MLYGVVSSWATSSNLDGYPAGKHRYQRFASKLSCSLLISVSTVKRRDTLQSDGYRYRHVVSMDKVQCGCATTVLCSGIYHGVSQQADLARLTLQTPIAIQHLYCEAVRSSAEGKTTKQLSLTARRLRTVDLELPHFETLERRLNTIIHVQQTHSHRSAAVCLNNTHRKYEGISNRGARHRMLVQQRLITMARRMLSSVVAANSTDAMQPSKLTTEEVHKPALTCTDYG